MNAMTGALGKISSYLGGVGSARKQLSDASFTDSFHLPLYKDGFKDILEERRQKSDILYCLKSRNSVPVYEYHQSRTIKDINRHVIESDLVKLEIEKTAKVMGKNPEEVREIAVSIVEEMAHTLDTKTVRSFAWFSAKLLKRLFKRLYVNEEAIDSLRQLMREYPVLIMPSHRSYLDVFICDWVFFEYDLPMPSLASALDFSKMFLIGEYMRRSGAFYIRRKFGDDALYWAVFTEYVQTQVRNSDAPMVFCIEGTRSKTGKSYKPKLGLMSTALETYFKGEVPDVMMIPISICYDKLLEEGLCAYELLEKKAPKSSSWGLINDVFAKDYGCLHFNIGKAVSIRDFCVGKINRSLSRLEPGFVQRLTSEEGALIKRVAHHVVNIQQKNLIITPMSLLAAVILQFQEGIQIQELVKCMEWLRQQCSMHAVSINWPNQSTTSAVIHACMSFHGNLIMFSDKSCTAVTIKQESLELPKNAQDVLSDSAVYLKLAAYRNKLLYGFVSPAMLSLVINNSEKDRLTRDELYSQYVFLESVFQYDFIFEPDCTQEDFNRALNFLLQGGELSQVQDDTYMIKHANSKYTSFLNNMFEPFLIAYWVFCQFVLSVYECGNDPALTMLSKLPKNVQQLSASLLEQKVVKHHEIVSVDVLNNISQALTDLKVLQKRQREEKIYLIPNHQELMKVIQNLEKFVSIPKKHSTEYLKKTVAALISRL